jgi:hypothetical protein
MVTPRINYGAQLLPDGRVLFAGGADAIGNGIKKAEVFDPKANGGAGAFVATGDMITARNSFPTALLPDGRVLVSGGYVSATAGTWTGASEIWDPKANGGMGAFTATGSLNISRFDHVATTSMGKVVVAFGGGNSGALSCVETFDPLANAGAGAFTLGACGSRERDLPLYALLGSGRTLYAGDGDLIPLQTAEIYDPFGKQFAPLPQMTAPRGYSAAVRLANGKVLIAGGIVSGSWTPIASAELFTPSP